MLGLTHAVICASIDEIMTVGYWFRFLGTLNCIIIVSPLLSCLGLIFQRFLHKLDTSNGYGVLDCGSQDDWNIRLWHCQLLYIPNKTPPPRLMDRYRYLPEIIYHFAYRFAYIYCIHIHIFCIQIIIRVEIFSRDVFQHHHEDSWFIQ